MIEEGEDAEFKLSLLQAALLRLTGPTRPEYTLRWKPQSFFDPGEEAIQCVPVDGEQDTHSRTALHRNATSAKDYVRGSNQQLPFLPGGFDEAGRTKEETATFSDDEKLIREKLKELLKTGDESWFRERLSRLKQEENEEKKEEKKDLFTLGENDDGMIEKLVPDEEKQRELDKTRAQRGLELGDTYAIGANDGGSYVQVSTKQEAFNLASVFDGMFEEDEGFADNDDEQETEDEAEDKEGIEGEKEEMHRLSNLANDKLQVNDDEDEDEVEFGHLVGDYTPFWNSFADGKKNTKWRAALNADEHAAIDIVDVSDFRTLVPEPAIDYPFELDPFQKRAVIRLERNESVFVAAHTSAGKTVVAEYAIALAAQHKTKVIYTSPIKTLSNQKFRDFNDRFGDVGIITGDISVNPEAFCLVMTTEILRSMLYRGADLIRDIEWVIFDELHYLNDRERGVVWEETIILLPPHVNFVMLSATVPNAMDFSSWVGRTKKRPIYVITTDKRPVPLVHSLFVNNELFQLLHSTKKVFQRLNYKAAKTKLNGEDKSQSFRGNRAHSWPRFVKYLRQRKLDPAIIFCFSKRKCEEAAESLGTVDLTTGAADRSRIHAFFESSISRLSPPDREVPQIARHREMVKRGIGVHHSGILPIVKEITEVLFQRGLVRVLFATETFAMGVNMPARTVAFSGIRKYSSQGRRLLEPGEYVQMAGRAGRRGLDTVGTVLLYFSPAEFPSELDLETVLNGRPKELRSQFRLTYNSVLNLLRTASLRVEDIMSRSFSENNAKRGSSKTKKYFTLWKQRLDEIAKQSPHLDRFRDYHEDLITAREIAASLYKEKVVSDNKVMFAPGRVLIVLRGDGVLSLAVVISKSRSGPKLSLKKSTIASVSGLVKVVVLAGGPRVEDIASPFVLKPRAQAGGSLKEYEAAGAVLYIGDLQASDILVGTKAQIDIPQRQLNPIRGEPTAQALASAADKLINFVKENTSPESLALQALDPIDDLNVRDIELNEEFHELAQRTRIMTNTLNASPYLVEEGLKESLGLLTEERQLRKKVKKLEDGMSENSLQFMPDYKQRLAVLKQLGYVADSVPLSVLLKGRAACEVNTCESLIVTELVFENHLEPLSISELAALLSSLVYQQKSDVSADEDLDAIQKISEPLFTACQALQKTMAGIAGAQAEQGLPIAVTEYVQGSAKWGMVIAVKAWAEGETFVKVCELVPEVAEGTIVRCIVRLCELLRETKNLARVVGNSELMEKAENAVIHCKRDVIFAASLYVQ